MARSTFRHRRAVRAVVLAAILLAALCLVIGQPVTPARAATNQFKGVK
jgi:hypothetical protein